MKFNYLFLFLALVGSCCVGCGSETAGRGGGQSANRVPAGWEAVADRQQYLPFYQDQVNNHPRISMPLQTVFAQNGGELTVYRGIVVGEKADKAREAIMAHNGKENCERFLDTAMMTPPLLICRTGEGVVVNYLFHDASPTETYVYATMDSTENDTSNPTDILYSFTSETAASRETQ